MDLSRTQSLTDTIHDSIDYSGIEREILGTPIFNRLHRIMQSSLVFLTYSSNKTKRFEHSIGVMDLAGKMFFSSVCNTKDDTLKLFLDEIKNAIKSWRKNTKFEHLSTVVPRNDISAYGVNRILTLPIPKSSLYRKFCPNNVCDLGEEEKFAYFVAFQAVRIAGLLHDVGHMPYSHVLEHAMNSLYNKVSALPEKDRNENQNKFLSDLYNYCDPKSKEKDEIHEEIGKICATKIFECIANTTSECLDNFFFLITYDFACSILQSKASDDNIYSDLHQIVAGIVDADRLDYCSRDAFCSGTRKDVINYRRLLATYSICRQKPDSPLLDESIQTNDSARQRFYFCPHVKNVQVIEDLLNRRWDIFSLINYHHRVHKHEILLEEVIVDLGYDELLDPKPIPSLSQEALPLKIYSIWQIIALLKGNDPPEYLLIQFDDSWLDTLLKRKFFYSFHDNFMWSSANADDPFWNKYDELISTQKHYYSVFKRTEDFRIADSMLFSRFKEDFESGGELQSLFSEDVCKKVSSYLKNINDHNVYIVKKKTMFFTWLINNTIFKITTLPENRAELFLEIQNEMNSILNPLNKIRDVILRDCTFKSGCATAKNKLMVADKETAKPFQNYSNIEQLLIARRNFSLPLHLYYLPCVSANAQTTDDPQIEKEVDLYPQFIEAVWRVIKKKIAATIKEED